MTGYLWRGKPGLIDLNAAIMAARDPETTRPVQPFEWGTHAVCGGHRNRHAFYRTRHGDTRTRSDGGDRDAVSRVFQNFVNQGKCPGPPGSDLRVTEVARKGSYQASGREEGEF